MLSFLQLLCCCGTRKSDSDERARLLQFQIPTTPSQPIQAHESNYQQRMGTIVRNMEGKMVNVSSRLPFNLHNRVIHDSMGSRSRSQSPGYNASEEYPTDDNDSYRLLHQQPSSHKQPCEQKYPVYYQTSRSRSPSAELASTENEHEAARPAAILSLKLVGISESERGRTRERTAKPTGLGGGALTAQSSDMKATNPSAASPPSSLDINFINPVLSSWSDPFPRPPFNRP
ncbi:hypothetical protein NP233_g5232 [Leucocoprinus birnbaumii]|uniref:Uncharacterized protein n=1 Tax=Leucocoprinus birnbaumii TaxID=56174 RepID=A0AAD5VVK0_9AGAR|nr:hypothetical protein NP233_g5232 [Leucocoprinus birnbaumii]